MSRISREPWRWAATGLFILAGMACRAATFDAHLAFFRIIGESAAFMCAVSGLGVLLDRNGIATNYAIIAGVTWFCYRGGLRELFHVTFGLGIFGVAIIWLTLPLIGIAIAYHLVMRDT